MLVEPEAPFDGGVTAEEPGPEHPNPSSRTHGTAKNERRSGRIHKKLPADGRKGHENAAHAQNA
jgi:hypothetical protein